MAIIYINATVKLVSGESWHACNGATRNHLILVNKTEIEGIFSQIEAQVGFYEGNRKSLIFLNPAKESDKRILGLFLNTECGYSVVKGKELFSASSVGGPKNSESQFGIYELGSILEVHSYANRRPSRFFELTSNGWKSIEDPLEGEPTEL